MSDREPNRRTNDSLQSGEGDVALGEDEREFGAAGQTVQRPLNGNDVPDRRTGRDPTVPRKQCAETSRRRP